jgi:hypothetical protein
VPERDLFLVGDNKICEKSFEKNETFPEDETYINIAA